jgi:3-oxoacyl-[acyl-carrier protein] reductase
MQFKGKNIFVTGGSRGIGAAIVIHLARAGARVAFSYNSQEESAKKILSELPDGNHFYVKMNLNESASIESACVTVLEKFESIHGVVNNAGLTKDTLLLRMKESDFKEVIQSNLVGTFLVSKQFIKTMLKQQFGVFVNLSSVIGSTGNAGQANYAASKAGIEAFTKSLAQELASRNIRANCVAPGFIETDMTSVLKDEQKSKILSQVPMNRMAHPSEIASVVAFMLSDESSYITGQTISVNGGMLMN